jgi:hypothetical protein
MAVPTPRMNTNTTANQSVITERTIINKATTLLRRGEEDESITKQLRLGGPT